MANVKFKTRRGRKVNFTTKPGRKKGSCKPNTYAKFVSKNIGTEYKKGAKPKTAMKRVAKKWEAQKTQ